ncbi:MAG: phage baseplate assembly protein V [Pseudomonadota bacterium]
MPDRKDKSPTTLSDADMEEAIGGGRQQGRVLADADWNEQTSTFLPEVEDEVLTGFTQGGTRAPVITGQLWNGKSRKGS